MCVLLASCKLASLLDHASWLCKMSTLILLFTSMCVYVCALPCYRARKVAAAVRATKAREPLQGGAAVYALHYLTHAMSAWKPGFFSCLGAPPEVQRRRKAQK